MSVISPPIEVTTKTGERLHLRLYPLTVSVSAYFIASDYLGTGSCPVKPGDAALLHCKHRPLAVAVPMWGPIESANFGRLPDFIQFHVVDRPPQPPNFSEWAAGINKQPTDNAKTVTPVFNNIVGPIFVEFFEAFKDWIHENSTPKRTDYWPAVWRFARVVRNAISHGGKIRIDRASEPSVEWHGLRYAPSDNGRSILGADVNASDLIILMFEMEDELKRLKCPFEL